MSAAAGGRHGDASATAAASSVPPSLLPGSGWHARLSLRFAAHGERTLLVRRDHDGPLMVQRPFHPEGAPCHVYVIHPPGGVVAGDLVELEAQVACSAHALLTTPGAGKFYRRGPCPPARVRCTLRVDDGTLEWLPQENIYYPGAEVETSTEVHLGGRARFVGWELTCLGLPSRAASLGDGWVRQRLGLFRDGEPLWLERTRYDDPRLRSLTGTRGQPGIGTWLGYPASGRDLDAARIVADTAEAEDPGTMLACTLVDGVLVCRGHAPRIDRLRREFTRLWHALRPSLIGRQAEPPRIWAT